MLMYATIHCHPAPTATPSQEKPRRIREISEDKPSFVLWKNSLQYWNLHTALHASCSNDRAFCTHNGNSQQQKANKSELSTSPVTKFCNRCKENGIVTRQDGLETVQEDSDTKQDSQFCGFSSNRLTWREEVRENISRRKHHAHAHHPNGHRGDGNDPYSKSCCFGIAGSKLIWYSHAVNFHKVSQSYTILLLSNEQLVTRISTESRIITKSREEHCT